MTMWSTPKTIKHTIVAKCIPIYACYYNKLNNISINLKVQKFKCSLFKSNVHFQLQTSCIMPAGLPSHHTSGNINTGVVAEPDITNAENGCWDVVIAVC